MHTFILVHLKTVYVMSERHGRWSKSRLQVENVSNVFDATLSEGFQTEQCCRPSEPHVALHSVRPGKSSAVARTCSVSYCRGAEQTAACCTLWDRGSWSSAGRLTSASAAAHLHLSLLLPLQQYDVGDADCQAWRLVTEQTYKQMKHSDADTVVEHCHECFALESSDIAINLSLYRMYKLH